MTNCFKNNELPVEDELGIPSKEICFKLTSKDSY